MSTSAWISAGFGDRNRAVRAALALVALFGVMAWFAFSGPMHEITFATCLADPARWNGKELRLSVQRVRAIEDGMIVVRAGRGLGRVRPPDGVLPAGVDRGVTISVEGMFRSDGYLDARRVYVHEARPWKNRASLVGMLGALGAGLVVFRWDRERGGLVERWDDA
ncbi:MAG: hypothetical protein U0610_22905 [bacterium]